MKRWKTIPQANGRPKKAGVATLGLPRWCSGKESACQAEDTFFSSAHGTNRWGLNHILLNNFWVNGETKGEIKYYLKTNKNENNIAKSMRCRKSSIQTFCSNKSLPQGTKNISNKQYNLTPKVTKKKKRKRKTEDAQICPFLLGQILIQPLKTES